MRTVILAAGLLASLPAFSHAAAEPAPQQTQPSTEQASPAEASQAQAPSAAAAPAQTLPAPPSGETARPEPPKTKIHSEKEALEDDGYKVSLSMPTEEDRTAWTAPGLRIDLAVEQGLLLAHGPAPRIRGTTFHLRPRLRIDRFWSVAATFGYSLASGDYTGVRWTALLEPVFHPTPSLGVSLALGYGGLSVTHGSASAPSPGSSEEIASRTLHDGERMYACSGGGWVSQARLEYLAVIGPLFSTGPYLLLDGQWTGCTESFGKADRETGQEALGRQWWLNLGGAIGWWFSWR